MISAVDFRAFFKEAYQADPFPWQIELAHQVLDDGFWPSVLKLPTGTGKTATLDVAVFHLAAEAARAPAERRAPRRITMVVDRRVVVDQAWRRASHLAARLQDAKPGTILHRVAEALRVISPGGPPLQAVQLRGGIARDDSWARTPAQPLVVASTVDQVGSRLLFRGYGVTRSMRPVHAGLMGHDLLLLLDEVHLALPFVQTLEHLDGGLPGYRSWREVSLPDRWQVVQMSATVPSAKGVSFQPDLTPEKQPEPLRRRLLSSKLATLEEVKVRARDPEPERVADFAREAAERAWKVFRRDRSSVLAVVLNRVAGARAAARRLIALAEGEDVDVELLTGRMRPLDRDHLLNPERGALWNRLRLGRERGPGIRPLILIATQCIEAGADFDFDSLVTECASLDALRQRFGRVDRDGVLKTSRSLILARSDQVAKDAEDPVYGHALARTWEWLKGLPEVDFGFRRLPAVEGLEPESAEVPPLLPAALDAWVQTRPEPQPDPPVDLWLHGVNPKPTLAEVQVVWRAEATWEEAEAALELAPPGSLEALALPLPAVRAWLQQATGDEEAVAADVEGVHLEVPPVAARTFRPAFKWGDERRPLESLNDLRPGDTIVVPTTYGGLWRGNWDPTSTEPVQDLGDRVQWEQRRRAVFRLHPLAVPQGAPPPPAPNADDAEAEAQAVREWLEQVPGDSWAHEAAQFVLDLGRLPIQSYGRRLAVVSRRPKQKSDMDTTTPPGGSEDEEVSSFIGVGISLSHHCRGVAHRVKLDAVQLGLEDRLADDLGLAALLHDVGKADPRFQAMLQAVRGSELLAKSRLSGADAAARETSRRQSGYPVGLRHELASVALLENNAVVRERAQDWDLVLHLVASHHGWCRPFAPQVADPTPVEVAVPLHRISEELPPVQLEALTSHGLERLDSPLPPRFWRLVRRYGWWGLAWLEAILRLADHRQSDQESREGG